MLIAAGNRNLALGAGIDAIVFRQQRTPSIPDHIAAGLIDLAYAVRACGIVAGRGDVLFAAGAQGQQAAASTHTGGSCIGIARVVPGDGTAEFVGGAHTGLTRRIATARLIVGATAVVVRGDFGGGAFADIRTLSHGFVDA